MKEVALKYDLERVADITEADPEQIKRVAIEYAKAENAVVATQFKNVDVIPASMDLAAAEVDLIEIEHREAALKNALAPIRENYDYIFIDCPPSLGLLTVNALTACDTVLIPIQCHFFALEGLTQLMNTVKLVKKHLNSAIDVEGVVLTMKDNRSNHVNQVSDEIRRFFNKKVFNTVIPSNIRLAEAPSYGLPVCKYDPKSKGAKAYSDLAREILERNNQL